MTMLHASQIAEAARAELGREAHVEEPDHLAAGVVIGVASRHGLPAVLWAPAMFAPGTLEDLAARHLAGVYPIYQMRRIYDRLGIACSSCHASLDAKSVTSEVRGGLVWCVIACAGCKAEIQSFPCDSLPLDAVGLDEVVLVERRSR